MQFNRIKMVLYLKSKILFQNSSLFQHYKLYELMFTQTQAEEIIGTDVSLIYLNFINL